MYCLHCGTETFSGQSACKRCGTSLPPERVEEKPYKLLQRLSQPLPFVILLLILLSPLAVFIGWKLFSQKAQSDPAKTVEAFYEAIEKKESDKALTYVATERQNTLSWDLKLLTGSDVTLDFKDLKFRVQDSAEATDDRQTVVRVTGTVTVSLGGDQREIPTFRDDITLKQDDSDWFITDTDVSYILSL
jgi:hypothetical protein